MDPSEIQQYKELSPIFAAAIGAGATLLGVTVTSIFNAFATSRAVKNQRRQKDKELKLEKMEELFFLFDKWQIHYSTVYLDHLRCHLGKLKYIDVMESTKKQNLLAPGEAQKYKMLLELYFPILAPSYTHVEAGRRAITPFLCDPEVKK
ncbi:hypothetical protein [Duganella sp. HH105]|uniref:hypothetical protein n=1 Tax=Duganella sp. HH105 TaxID=1781067 RepID=UPI00114CE71F|nr:hypothetical protein [Duganella sp. HH105]